MAIGSGLGSSFGMSTETTYGTYVAPTRWLEGVASLRKTKTTYQGGGMAAGRLVQPGARRYVTARGGAGTLVAPIYSTGMGLLINGLMGGTVTPVQQAATAAYLQTHALADPQGKQYTMQAGIPDMGGTVRPYTFLGCQVQSLELSLELGGALMGTWEMLVRDVSEAQSLAAPSYPARDERHWAEAAVKLGTFGAETTVDAIRRITLKIERPRHDGGPYLGNAGLRSHGIINAYAAITGTIEADYLDKTVFADRFAADSSTSLVFECVGPVIAAPNFQTFRVRVPQIFFDTDTPQAQSPDVVRTSYNFVGQYDGTNAAATIEYMSTDLAL